jgi:alpha-galactosidase
MIFHTGNYATGEESMPLPTKIVVIGAGSASFGENTLAALISSQRLRGSTLALVDHNSHNLDIVGRLAARLNRDWNAQICVTTHTHHQEALSGAEFVVMAIEVGPREQLWRQDYEIPLKYGVRQPYAENGGPGGFAHAARNIGPVMQIVRDMELICPQAWLINFTNPMIRICDAINRYSRIKVVGLCHQIFIGYCFAGMLLQADLGIVVPDGITGMHSDHSQNSLRDRVVAQIVPRIDLMAAGLNHFTWILALRDRQTGEDLYPLFCQRWADYDPAFEPLTRQVFAATGIFPVPGDSHLCEYLPWVSDSQTQPWDKYQLHLYEWDVRAEMRDQGLIRLGQMAEGRLPVDHLLESDSEGALEMIANVAGTGNHYHLAANLPNLGQIENLPLGAIVETPVIVNGSGVHPVHVGRLPEAVAELCRRETTVAQLCVDAAVQGDYQKGLQSLLLDPVVTDLDVARQILDDYLNTYRQYLPQFWRQGD